jgi:hypothetical protein
MFNKLLKNLPFNPSLINQVAFYSKRLRQEASIRRLGFLFIALTFAVQLFAVVAPPQPSVQASGNDLIEGGVTSQGQLVSRCQNDAKYQAILSWAGVSCDAVARGSVRTISSRDYGGQLFSMGYQDYAIAGETPVDVPGVGRTYMRYLWGWDSPGTTSHYTAVVGTRANGTPFVILYNCGNLATIGIPTPPPPVIVKIPKTLSCSALSMNVKAGSHVALGTAIVLHGQAAGSRLPSNQQADFYYSFKTDSGQKPTTLFHRVDFKGSNVGNDQTNHTYTLTQPGHYIFTLTVKSDLGTAPGSATGNCTKDVYVNKDTCKNPNDIEACIVHNKRASNITQKLTDANNTTAQAGDVIDYTLSATNTQKYNTVKKYVITENIGDILEYADVVTLNGGKLDAKNNVSWPAQDIKANQTIQAKFTVKVKDPIPQTPVSTSNPGSFDLTMTNSYGDTVTIHLPKTPGKIIESTASSLPNTGPGTNITIAVVLTMVVGYFFARSRLLAKEMDIVRVEYTSGS